MAENMMCPAHITSNKKYRREYERIFNDREKENDERENAKSDPQTRDR
jgi:Na+-translocating ferredoxin:NAD+ oxidoreductase RnfC subunit